MKKEFNVGDLLKWKHNNMLLYISEIRSKDLFIVKTLTFNHSTGVGYYNASVTRNKIRDGELNYYPVITD